MFRFDLTESDAHRAVAPTDGAIGRLKEEDLRRVGIELSSLQLPNEYLFSRMGGWNVMFRASFIRIVFFKLLGTGIAAMLTALSPHTGRYTAFSCALCAAVNFVACGHYWYIWQVRLQTYRGPKYDRFMSSVGRAAEEETALVKEAKQDERLVYWQEVTVDGLRHSDWLVTLVLMTLDLGHLREYLTLASGGVVPALRYGMSKEWLAALQSVMMLLASVWRFYTNEARDVLVRAARGELKAVYRPADLLTKVLGWASFVGASGVFGFIVFVLTADLPNDGSKLPHPSLESDVICLKVLVLVWIGYPLCAIAARLGHWNIHGDKYLASWSTIKDLSFALLDVTSKGGLAIFFVLKSSWVDGVTEAVILGPANNKLS